MALNTLTTSGLDQSAYNLDVFLSFRADAQFDKVADVQPTAQAMPGKTVIFTKQADIAAQTATLTEGTDVTPVTLSDSTVSVTLEEYGAAITATKKLRGTSYVAYDPLVADQITYSAVNSLETVISDVLDGGTNVDYAGSASTTGTVAATDTIASGDLRKVAANLKTNEVPRFDGNAYIAFIHPLTAHDLRSETGSAGWRQVHEYSLPTEIIDGEIGQYEGIRFVETSRAPWAANVGVGGTVDVYKTLILGQQALAKAYSVAPGYGSYPMVEETPVTDLLRRNEGMGWYWLGGFGIFREESLWRIESASSIGANT